MPSLIRLPLSVDHQKKKALSIELPFAIYLHFITTGEFEEILPKELKKKAQGLKKAFFAENQFFSEDYQHEYERSGYIRFLTGPDVHKFLAKVLSLNYQTHKNILQENAGSFQEYFGELKLFWNQKFHRATQDLTQESIREALFCHACVQTQHARLSEKTKLFDKLDDFAKQEIKAKELEIKRLRQKYSELEDDLHELRVKNEKLREDLAKAHEANMVLVPSDPYYMLGLETGNDKAVEARSKILLKALHPDKSGSADTAYLFDMVLKARDMVSK
ncbi:hypothetical protein MTBPR1_60175 [Candidatus Terasakiella magnetica]|uniref:J domain-containing protein n=1 Tax=Candidatus Terasakiella magnetica TaxID=1867952 RepID=A0A1C3RK51_9PROT|nr:hypothetical protein [Candidatus Terasakiella magnetica]SCA57662.1 hypothetical protein MTBPR1_60175 [Candidatus Terasakiella magnetica]